MNKFSIYWIVWASVMFVSFAIPEFWALANSRPEDTLSENVWRLEQFLPGQDIWHWTALHILIGGVLFLVCGWLALHLSAGLWR